MTSPTVAITITSSQTNDNGVVIPVALIPESLSSVKTLAKLYIDLLNVKLSRSTIMSLSSEQKLFLDTLATMSSGYYAGSSIEQLVTDYKIVRKTIPAKVTMNHAISLLDDLGSLLITENSKEKYIKVLETKKSTIVAENTRIQLIPIVEKLISLADTFASTPKENYDEIRKKQYREQKQSNPFLWDLFWKLMEDRQSLKHTPSPDYEQSDFKAIRKRFEFLKDELTKILCPEQAK